MKSLRVAALSLAGVAALATSVSALAQGPDPAALAGQYAANAKQNATLMRQYSWQMRVALTIKGEAKPAQIYQMQFAPGGGIQKTLLTAPPAPPTGLGKRIKEDKIAEFKQWADGLADLVKSYMAPTPGNMMDFYSKAAFSSFADGTVQVSGNSFLQPGDSATFWVDRDTKAARRYAFTTSLNGDPVSGQVTYGNVAGGPQYAAQTLVNVPAKEVSATIENFNFIKQ